MNKREEYIEKHLNRKNMVRPVYIYDINGNTFKDVKDKLLSEIKKTFGEKYINDDLWNEVKFETEYELSPVSATLLIQEMDEDRDKRISKDIITFGKIFDHEQLQETKREKRVEKFEKDTYLRLKRKFESK